MSDTRELTQQQKLDRFAAREAARDCSTGWRLGVRSGYKWRANDPERDAKIAAERAESAQKSAAAKARFAKPRGQREPASG